MQIITNNPMVIDKGYTCSVKKIDGPLLDVLYEVKRLVIEEKKRLHTHPLSSSLKPNETVYKTIVISSKPSESVDLNSLELMEQAIAVHEKFQNNFKTPHWPERVLKDFALIDCDLIDNAMNRLQFAD